jgi:hypothetical protein
MAVTSSGFPPSPNRIAPVNGVSFNWGFFICTGWPFIGFFAKPLPIDTFFVFYNQECNPPSFGGKVYVVGLFPSRKSIV